MHKSNFPLNLLLCLALYFENAAAQAGQTPARLMTPFDEAAVKWAKAPGTSVIEGRAQLKTPEGELKYGTQSTIVLIPVSAHTTEWFERHIVKGEAVEIPDPRISPYDHFTTADYNGHFRFTGIAAGEYYIVGNVSWRDTRNANGEDSGRDLAIKVRAEPGRTVRVRLGFQEEDRCYGYVGQTVAPMGFETAIQPFMRVAPKGEFETSAAYLARSGPVLSPAMRALIIAKTPEDRKFITYDADSQVLRIAEFAFSNANFDAFSAFHAAGLDETIQAGSQNFDAVVSRSDTPLGTYRASNSFGATTTVLRIHRVTKVIFDRENVDLVKGIGLFPDIMDAPWSVGELAMSPGEAQVLKPSLRLALVVVPKAPFFVRGTHKVGDVTVQHPEDVTEDFKILIADIQCGLVTDAKNKVLGAYPTN